MTAVEATQFLSSLTDYEKHPAHQAATRYLNLDRMREALARAGNPHLRVRTVHIAGTKGKGSTAAMTAAILRAAGRRVGLFTSPHLITFHERIQVDGEMIPADAFAALVDEIRPIIDAMRDTPGGPPTFFEACALIAFLWFLRCEVDIAVLETGMGGRLDATNVVTPLATAITTIALDHQEELGATLELIAAEKAGIIKPAVPVVRAPQDPAAAAVIDRIARDHGSPLCRVGDEVHLQPSSLFSPVGQRFTVVGQHGTYADLAIPLLGDHQQINAAVAIGLAECLYEAGEPITAEAIRAGLATVSWPGRMQVLRDAPLVLLDGAHDPASMVALLAGLDRHFPGRPRRYLLGFSREKDWPQMLRQLAPSAREFILTAAATPRSVAPEHLAREAEALGVPLTLAPTAADALADALARSAPEELLCVTGSLYLVGDALRWWTDLRSSR